MSSRESPSFTLFTYVITRDRGRAPNPFWGWCTMVVCKPDIRLQAQEGDWVVATGSKRGPDNVRGRVVFAMEVRKILSMEEYDAYTRRKLPEKIPDYQSADWRRWVGDSLYDFTLDPPRQRDSDHDERHRASDLRGGFALLSDHFYYFGSQAQPLPDELLPIVHQGRGQSSRRNDPYRRAFQTWIQSLEFEPNIPLADPQHRPSNASEVCGHAACGPLTRSCSTAHSSSPHVRTRARASCSR